MSLFQSHDMVDAYPIADEQTARLDATEIISLVYDRLMGGDFTVESICALMEVLRRRFKSIQVMNHLIDALHEIGGSANKYLSAAYILTAQIYIEVNDDSSHARSLLAKVNPLQLENMPATYLVRCYLLKSRSADQSDQKQKSKMLDRAWKAYERTKSTISPRHQAKLEFKLLCQQFQVQLADKNLLECLSTCLDALELYPRRPEYFGPDPQFANNLHHLVSLLIYLPYTTAKVDILTRFSEMIGCGCDKSTSELRKWLEAQLGMGTIRDIVCRMAQGKLVRLNMPDFNTSIEQLFNDPIKCKEAKRNLIEANVLVISTHFKSIKLKTMMNLIGVKAGDEEQLMMMIADLILRNKIDATIDQVTGFVDFHDSSKEWEQRTADVFVGIDNVVGRIDGI